MHDASVTPADVGLEPLSRTSPTSAFYSSQRVARPARTQGADLPPKSTPKRSYLLVGGAAAVRLPTCASRAPFLSVRSTDGLEDECLGVRQQRTIAGQDLPPTHSAIIKTARPMGQCIHRLLHVRLASAIGHERQRELRIAQQAT